VLFVLLLLARAYRASTREDILAGTRHRRTATPGSADTLQHKHGCTSAFKSWVFTCHSCHSVDQLLVSSVSLVTQTASMAQGKSCTDGCGHVVRQVELHMAPPTPQQTHPLPPTSRIGADSRLLSLVYTSRAEPDATGLVEAMFCDTRVAAAALAA
jgi:hypothetical protein